MTIACQQQKVVWAQMARERIQQDKCATDSAHRPERAPVVKHGGARCGIAEEPLKINAAAGGIHGGQIKGWQLEV